jgi:hypothetical protein
MFLAMMPSCLPVDDIIAISDLACKADFGDFWQVSSLDKPNIPGILAKV